MKCRSPMARFLFIIMTHNQTIGAILHFLPPSLPPSLPLSLSLCFSQPLSVSLFLPVSASPLSLFLPVSLSVPLSLYLGLSLSLCSNLSLSLSLFLPISLSLYLCFSLYLCLLSLFLPVSLILFLSVSLCLSVSPCLSLSLSFFPCLSFSLSLSLSLSLYFSLYIQSSDPPLIPSYQHPTICYFRLSAQTHLKVSPFLRSFQVHYRSAQSLGVCLILSIRLTIYHIDEFYIINQRDLIQLCTLNYRMFKEA